MDWATVLSTELTGLNGEVTTAVTAILPIALFIIGIGVVWKVIKRFIKSA